MMLALLECASGDIATADTRFLQGLGDHRYHQVESRIVGRDYHVFVMLPDGYERSPNQLYPAIYVLDGGKLFPMLSAYYGYLKSGGEIPEAIIVGISYGTDDFRKGNFRSTDYTAPSSERDYWGGAGKFQAFLAGELLPLVERSYRARPDRRVLFGQSIGGQFVLYTALTRPRLFWGHVASNPALHRNLPFYLEQRWEPLPAGERSRLFVSSGSHDDPRFRTPALTWIEHWSGRSDLPWQLETTTLQGHSHMSAPPAAFRQGMRWLFADN